jgi:hypothetical protein
LFTYGDNGAAASSSRMRCLLEDILASKAPVAPAEVTNLVEGHKIQCYNHKCTH